MASNSNQPQPQQSVEQDQEEPVVVHISSDSDITDCEDSPPVQPAPAPPQPQQQRPEPILVDLTTSPGPSRKRVQQPQTTGCRKVYDISGGEPDIILSGIAFRGPSTIVKRSTGLNPNYNGCADHLMAHMPIGTIDLASDTETDDTDDSLRDYVFHSSRNNGNSIATEVIDPSELDQDIADAENELQLQQAEIPQQPPNNN